MIVIGCDHAGFNLKNQFVEYFNNNKIEYADLGAKAFELQDSFVDYAKNAVDFYVKNCDLQKDILLLICGSGVGVSIVANRSSKIRAVLCYDKVQAEQGRMHNDCNCLCLGERNTNFDKALEIFNTFLQTEFLGGKYKDRIDSI